MKILQINKLYHPWIGGIESAVKAAAEGLKDEDEMTVLVCSPKGKGSKESINGVRVIRASSMGIKFSMPLSLSFPFCVKKYAKEADVIILHDPFPLGDLAVLMSGTKAKVAVWWHSDIVRQKKMRRLITPLIHGILKRADGIFTATQGHINGSDFLTEYRDKCRIVPYGIDTQKYLSAKTTPVLSVKLHNKENIKVLFAGRLVYYKGVDVLIKAFENINGAELFLIGKGADETELEKLAENQKNKIHFLGNLSDEDMKAAFSDCDIFVLPSVEKSEAFGIVQLEAMIYSKPVINTALNSGAPMVSLDKITGLTVPPSDVRALHDALETLINDKALREKYGAAAKKRVLENFGIEIMCKNLHRECEKLIKV